MAAKTKQAAQWMSLLQEADKAGQKAVEALNVTPMVVKNPSTGETWFVGDGVCGFAWVKFPGNTAFGRWAKAEGIARPGYPTGLSIWVSQYNQSMQKKEAYARAFAAVLSEAGINAYAESRID